MLTRAGVGAGEKPWAWPAGHNCYFSEAWLEIRVDEPSTGQRTQLGDRPVLLETDGGFCDIVVGGTIADDAIGKNGLSAADVCPAAWATAEKAVPTLPQ